MAWTGLTFSFGSLLTSTKMTQLQDNLTALANGDSGAPSVQTAGIADDAVTLAKMANSSVDTAELVNGSVTFAKLSFTQGSYSAAIGATSSAYPETHEYVHGGVVGGSNISTVYWGWADGAVASGANTSGDACRLQGYNSSGSPQTGHVTWRYHT